MENVSGYLEQQFAFPLVVNKLIHPQIWLMRYLMITSVLLMCLATFAQQQAPTLHFKNGLWFNGTGFEQKDMYSMAGVFVENKSSAVDSVVDLEGAYIIPPFADAHNHSIGTGSEELDQKAINSYLAAGVFYVKIPGNLPMKEEARKKLSAGNPKTIDVIFSQGSITATGGMPIFIVEKWHPALGFNKGYTLEQLKDFRYFTVNSEEELERKWPAIMAQKPDFIKTFLWNSNNFEKLRDDTSVYLKGLDPELLPKIVVKARQHQLRVSAHVINSADFQRAVRVGVDEINHLPRFESGASNQLIDRADAKEAAAKGIVVVTTAAISIFQGGMVKEADRPLARQYQINTLKILKEQGVTLAIGSDDIADNSYRETFYLQGLGVFDNLTLLKIWTGNTARTIFPNRKIGELKEGYEASFLALEASPLEDLKNVKRIKLKVKQGEILAH